MDLQGQRAQLQRQLHEVEQELDDVKRELNDTMAKLEGVRYQNSEQARTVSVLLLSECILFMYTLRRSKDWRLLKER
jgi:septal ring factor EnvC (AmiA/AmiB activator)